VTDENSAGYPSPSAVPPTAPPAVPPQPQQVPAGGFDWLIESHQQSAPMAPLTDDVPSPIPAQPRFDFSDPGAPPTRPFVVSPPVHQPVQPPVSTPPPSVTAPPPVFAPPPVAVAPFAPSAPPAAFTPPGQPVAQRAPLGAGPAAPSFAGAPGSAAFALERHESRSRSGNGPLDWVAFVLAFLAPPVGLLVGIGAAIADSRGKGYVASIAKAAIGIGAALSLILGVVSVVVGKIDSDQATHDAIVASSRTYCTRLESNPATLTSDTFGWPAPGDTIPDSITAMETYVSTWKSLVAVAPAGIRADTRKVEVTAASIASSVQSTQTLDNASNVAQMQDAVAATGIRTWVLNYCP
jgi:hypothetical protein